MVNYMNYMRYALAMLLGVSASINAMQDANKPATLNSEAAYVQYINCIRSTARPLWQRALVVERFGELMKSRYGSESEFTEGLKEDARLISNDLFHCESLYRRQLAEIKRAQFEKNDSK